MSDDAVLDRIDATIRGLCACGCGTGLGSDGPSAYWASDQCMRVWQGRTQAEAPEEVMLRPDAHEQYIPPAESRLPARGGTDTPEYSQFRERVRAQAREQIRRERQPSPSRLDHLRDLMVEHLHGIMNDPAQVRDGFRDSQRPVWPEELVGPVVTEMQLASSDGRRWQIRPGEQARAEISIDRDLPEMTPYGRGGPDWVAADRQRTTVTVTWIGPWHLTIMEPGAASAGSGRG